MVRMFDRLLLFIYSFIIACTMIIVICMASGWIGYNFAENYLNNLYNEPLVTNSLIVTAILFLLFSVRLFYLSVRRDRSRVPSIDQQTDYGKVSISMETIQNLALKAAGTIKGISELKSRIQINESGLEIVLRTNVDGENSIPQLTEDVQRMVKEQVELMTGIPVVSVSVNVVNIITASAPSFKRRVE
jgi:uncharacterized alkaline shock family protein YloU